MPCRPASGARFASMPSRSSTWARCSEARRIASLTSNRTNDANLASAPAAPETKDSAKRAAVRLELDAPCEAPIPTPEVRLTATADWADNETVITIREIEQRVDSWASPRRRSSYGRRTPSRGPGAGRSGAGSRSELFRRNSSMRRFDSIRRSSRSVATSRSLDEACTSSRGNVRDISISLP